MISSWKLLQEWSTFVGFRHKYIYIENSCRVLSACWQFTHSQHTKFIYHLPVKQYRDRKFHNGYWHLVQRVWAVPFFLFHGTKSRLKYVVTALASSLQIGRKLINCWIDCLFTEQLDLMDYILWFWKFFKEWYVNSISLILVAVSILPMSPESDSAGTEFFSFTFSVKQIFSQA